MPSLTPPPPPVNNLVEHPLVNMIAGYIVQLQGHPMLTKQRLLSLRQSFLVTVGFLVLLYCLIHIQILFFWLLKFLFRLLFKIFSLIFWLPLRTVRLLLPKSVDYDILFPLFWLCSIASFYVSKFSHESICQFYDEHLVRRYKSLQYDPAKRGDIRRYLFIGTFLVLLLVQCLFILTPIALSIRNHHANSKVSSTPMIVTPTTTVQTTTAKSAVKGVVETMRANVYKRFINAFTDDNETYVSEKRKPLVSDEQLEETVKSLRKTIKSGIESIKPTDKPKEVQEEKKSSRFQRWIIHYLKAPFQKWESKKPAVINSKDEQNKLDDQEEEEYVQINSSSSLLDAEESDQEDEDDNDDDDDDDDDLSGSDVDDDEDDDDDIQEENASIRDKLQQGLDSASNLGEKLKDKLFSSSKDKDDDNGSLSIQQRLAESVTNIKELKKKFSPSTTNEDEGSDSDDELIENAKTISQAVEDKLQSKLHSSIDAYDEDEESGYDSDDEGEQFTTLTDKAKETLGESVEKVKSNVKDKVVSALENDDEAVVSISDKIKEGLGKPVEVVKEFGEDVITNVKNKLSSPAGNDKEEEEDPSMMNRAQEAAEKVISVANELRHKTVDILDTAEEYAENAVKQSAEFIVKKAKDAKKRLPKPDKVISKIKHDVVEPLEAEAAKLKKELETKADQIKTTVVGKIKALKKEKKPKTLSEKAKEKLQSIADSIQEKLPGRKKKVKEAKLLDKIASKLQLKNRINGWFDEAWNIWHLAKSNLAHIFISSTKHARHLPRYNSTSLYTAYTDVKCSPYARKLNRYRLGKQSYLYFLDTYRRHSPFLVYLSILKSNGPKCYRHYPDSSCALIQKIPKGSFKAKIYRFVRFWALMGLIGVILSAIYKYYLSLPKSQSSSPFRQHRDFDRSTDRKQTTRTSSSPSKTDLSKTTQKTSSDNENNTSANNSTQPLDPTIDQQLQLWLQREQNDGFRNLSETCRLAINNTFLKQLDRLSVETLQFANAKIHNVSQNNNNRTTETTAEKIIINAVLDIDHLTLNMVHTFREQHFSVETQKLSGQIYILLVVNTNQYSIEANLQQLHIYPVNIIDSNHALSESDKQNLVKLLDETISRTVVRCSFRLSDAQEAPNATHLYNSSTISPSGATKPSTSSAQLTTSSIQTTTSRSPQLNSAKYQPNDSIPTVLINSTHPPSYTSDSLINKESKRLLVRIVKAVKLHDVEQPYCILELNHPQQVQKTSIANNGLNPFWDERFLFECDDKSNQIHLQIIDRKQAIKRTGNNYVDTVHADVLIPFSYVQNTIYKQDVQFSPQHPESIIRLEFSTLSEEDALAASNGYDVESLTDSQNWTFNDREGNRIDQEYPHQFQQSTSNDFLTSSYDVGSLPKHYGLSSTIYDDERDYASTIPRTTGASPYSPSTPLTPRDGAGLTGDKPQKSKSFMSSLKHLTLPRRKHNKNKYDTSMGSQTSSITHLNTPLQSPPTNLTSHSLSSEYFLSNTMESTPIRRSRSISQSFRNLFRSSSKKKAMAARADAMGEFENGTHNYVSDNRSHLSTSVPTSKKLSFLQRRKSKQKAKNQSTNSLSSYDCSRMESVRDTPIRANVGHPVTMTKSLVR
ncbi:unnamed protein product [Adineta ricciae]|uniref:C2 domain-containing protein n=1 Tax=Adineta ricciae TaxID=249248 RepID=A0A814L721_ADIRI|nr:unnamed protein product [Adineta ricciae]